MTSSTKAKAELRVTLAHDPRVMGYVYCVAELYFGNGQSRTAFSWHEENGVMSRSQLVSTIVELVKDLRPARVGFRAAQRDQLSAGATPAESFNYWSPETLRDVISGTRDADDLLVV